MTTETTIDGQVTVTSGWKRASITVSELCPRESIDFLIDREPVGTIDEDIRNIVRRRIDALKVTGQASKWTSERELEAIAYALWKHRENQACYRYVLTGMTTGLCVDCGSTKKMHAGRLEREEKGAHEYHPSEEKEA